jgi:hypothetical protein
MTGLRKPTWEEFVALYGVVTGDSDPEATLGALVAVMGEVDYQVWQMCCTIRRLGAAVDAAYETLEARSYV